MLRNSSQVVVMPSAFGDGAVMPSALGDGAVMPSAFGDGAVMPSALGDGAVMPSAFGDGAVMPSAFGDGVVMPSAFGASGISPFQRVTRRALRALGMTALVLALLPAPTAKAELGDFQGYDIRVIRPRYMAKRNRMELGSQGTLVMNQSFIYTLMATGLLDYHFSEMFALELGMSYGFSIDKEDKRVLEDEFDINTQILRTQYIFGGGLMWTPIYGKTQLPSGQVVYFDSFLTAQAGMTGIEYTYEQCITPPAEKAGELPSKPAAQTKGYPTLNLGFGQKYFLSQDFSLRWDVRDYIFQYEKGDGSCTPDVPVGSAVHQNITLQMGAATFF